MLTLKMEPQAEKRLASLARKSGKSKSGLAKEFIMEYLEELEDARLAAERLRKPERIFTREEVRRELDIQL